MRSRFLLTTKILFFFSPVFMTAALGLYVIALSICVCLRVRACPHIGSLYFLLEKIKVSGNICRLSFSRLTRANLLLSLSRDIVSGSSHLLEYPSGWALRLHRHGRHLNLISRGRTKEMQTKTRSFCTTKGKKGIFSFLAVQGTECTPRVFLHSSWTFWSRKRNAFSAAWFMTA